MSGPVDPSRPAGLGGRIPPLHLPLSLGLLLLPGLLWGQEVPALSLDEALRRAGQFNPDYRIALNDLDLGPAQRREALGAFLPSLDFQARSGLSFDRQLISTDFFGNPIENPVAEWVTSSSSSQYLGGSITLCEGGQRCQQLTIQGAQARAREATVASRLRTLRAEVIRIYHRAQAQQATLRVEEDLLEGRRLDLDLTRRMFDLAGATRVEVLAAELNLQRQEQRIQQTEAQVEQGLLSLRRAIGDPQLEAFSLSEVLPEPSDPTSLDPDELVARAHATSPTIQEQVAQVDVGAAQMRAARGNRWPSMSVSFGFNQRTFALKKDALFDPWPSQGRYGSAGFTLSIPIFSRFQTSARIAEAQVAADNAQEALRRTRLQVEEEVRSRLISLRTAYQGYQIALRSREIAQERLRLAREQFRLGSRTFNELQRDIDDAASAEREVITQLFGFVEARTNLEETVGVLDVELGLSEGSRGASSGNPGAQGTGG